MLMSMLSDPLQNSSSGVLSSATRRHSLDQERL